MSSRTSLPEIQTMLYGVMHGDATLMAILTAIIDFGAVLPLTQMPYATIGDTTEAPLNAFGHRGYLATVRVHLWDNVGGFERLYPVLARMNTLLDQVINILPTQTMVYMLFQQVHPLNDPGLESIRHLVVEYSVFTQE